MTKQEIIDYNKRCTKFLGFKYKNSKKVWGKYPLDNNSFLSLKGWLFMDKLQFHSDWNWIMEVVEAIKKKTSFKTVDECSEKEWYVTTGVTKLVITTKKEAVVQAINQFLIWYNNENS